MKRKAEEAGLEPLPQAAIQQQPAGTSGTGPFLVYFPANLPPESREACEFDAYAHGQRKNQYTVVARTKEMPVDYVGSTTNAEYSIAPPRLALGLYSRSANRLEVMPTEGGRVLRLEPRVHRLSYGPAGTTTLIEAGQMKEANMRLVEAFGSQRRKRQLKAREAGRVEAQHVSAAQAVLGMIANAGEAAGATKDEVIAASLAQRNIPPHHPEATSAEQAYRADEIVPLSIRDGLEIRKLFPATNKPEYKETLRSSGMFGDSYVLSRLPLLGASEQAVREERARLLCLLGHLLKMHNKWNMLRAGPGGLAGLAEKLKMEASVAEGLLELFYSEEAGYQGSKYLLTKDKKSLMLGYILILAIRAEERSCLEPEQLQALADELKLRPQELVQRYRELGCVDSAVSALNEEGTRIRSSRVLLMPAGVEDKTLADYFPKLKLGGKKR